MEFQIKINFNIAFLRLWRCCSQWRACWEIVRTWVQTLSTHIKAGHSCRQLLSWCWGGKDRKVLGDHWPASLAESMSSRGSDRLCLKDGEQHPTLTSGCHMYELTHMWSCIHTQTYIHNISHVYTHIHSCLFKSNYQEKFDFSNLI